MLKETPIRLDFKDAPLEDVVKSLAKQAGFNVVLAQAAPDVGARRITLQEPKPIPFWQAIDRVCEAGRLSAMYQNMGLRGPGMPQPGLALSSFPDRLTPKSDNRGPFQLGVDSLSYTSQISLQASARMMARARVPAGGMGGMLKKGADAKGRRFIPRP